MQPDGRDALAELDVELGLAERRGDLVLDDLDADPVADRLGAVLERLDAADVEPLGRVELQRAAARLGLRRAEHDADLLADLVDEQAERLRAVQVAGELAHRLATSSAPAGRPSGRPSGPRARRAASAPRRSRSRRRRPRRSARACRRSPAPARRSRAGRRAARRCPRRCRWAYSGSIACSASMNAHTPPSFWASAMHVVDERRLAGGLRAEDLDDAPARHAADAEREVERQRARRDRVDLDLGALVAHAHDAALAELALDLRRARPAGRRRGPWRPGCSFGGGSSASRHRTALATLGGGERTRSCPSASDGTRDVTETTAFVRGSATELARGRARSYRAPRRDAVRETNSVSAGAGGELERLRARPRHAPAGRAPAGPQRARRSRAARNGRASGARRPRRRQRRPRRAPAAPPSAPSRSSSRGAQHARRGAAGAAARRRARAAAPGDRRAPQHLHASRRRPPPDDARGRPA